MALGDTKTHGWRYWNSCGAGIAIVARVTEGIDWAAYIGADDGQSEMMCVARTADEGGKLSEVDARHFFPDIELSYRH